MAPIGQGGGTADSGLASPESELGFNFVSGQRPQPNKNGHIPTTMEWARKLTADDIKILKGEAALQRARARSG